MKKDFEANEYEERETYIEPVRKMGIFEKLKYLFISPSKAFENIKDHPNMWAAMLITIIFSIITSIVSIDIVNLVAEKYTMLMSQMSGTEIPYVETSLNAKYIISTIIKTPFAIGLAWISTTFFLWLINKIFGGKVNFSTMLSFQAHILMFSYIVGLIATIPQILMNSDVNIFSFAILFPDGDMSSFFYNILQSTSLTTIWIAVVTGIGLSILNGYDKAKGYIVSATYYILGILVSAGIATVSLIILGSLKNFI